MAHPLHPLTLAALLSQLTAAAACTPFRDDPSDASPPAISIDSSSRSLWRDGCDLSKPFGAPTFLPGFTPLAAQTPGLVRLSRDQLSAYFAALGPSSAGFVDLYAGTRSAPDGPFGSFVRLATLDTRDFDWWPSVSGDGLTLVFERAAPDHAPGHIHYATRSEPAGEFSYVGPLATINSAAVDSEPFLRDDGEVLYFVSDRAMPSDLDIYRATAPAPAAGRSWDFGAPVAVDELNSPYWDSSPTVTADDRTIYFASDRPAGDAVRHIWTAHRADTSQRFSQPVPVDELRRIGDDQIPSFITPDGCSLYLSIKGADPPTMAYVAQKPPR